MKSLRLSCGFVLLCLSSLAPTPASASEPEAPTPALDTYGVPSRALSAGRGNVRLNSPDPGAAQPEVAVNPGDPRQVIASAYALGLFDGQLQFYSRDGGATWKYTELPQVENDAVHLPDASLAWTSDGVAWVNVPGAELQLDGQGNVRDVLVRQRTYRSEDGGATWALDSTPSQDFVKSAEGMTWVDPSAASPYRDTLYACWTDIGQTYVSARPHGVARWSPPARVSAAENQGLATHCSFTTNQRGDAFVFWIGSVSGQVFFSRSSDGGMSWSAEKTIAQAFAHSDSLSAAPAFGVPAASFRGVRPIVASAASRSGARNLVLAAWTDLSGENGCTRLEDEPFENPRSRCKSRIWVVQSSDGGETWGSAHKVRDLARLNDQFFPRLAVEPLSGRIGLIYYDTTADPKRRATDLWFQSTTDGAHWGAPRRISTAHTDLSDPGPGGASYFQYGESIGLSPTPGGYVAVWTDRRERHLQHIWSARIDAR